MGEIKDANALQCFAHVCALQDVVLIPVLSTALDLILTPPLKTF